MRKEEVREARRRGLRGGVVRDLRPVGAPFVLSNDVYIYIYIERERERFHICIYVYDEFTRLARD